MNESKIDEWLQVIEYLNIQVFHSLKKMKTLLEHN